MGGWGERLRGATERWLPVLVVLAIALIAVVPALAVAGIVATRAGGDSPFLLQRVHQMAAALAALHIPARWMPDAAYGLGYPFWNYYAPLAYIVAGAIALLGGGVVGAIKVSTLLWFTVAALGVYRLAARSVGTRAAGVVAAASYTVAPYHMVNVYVRGDALAELAAYAIAPWALLAVDRAVYRRDAASAAVLAFTLGLLVISHTISAMLIMPLILVYAVWRLAALLRNQRGERAPTRPPGVTARQIVARGDGLAVLPSLTMRLALALERWAWPWRWRPGVRAVLAIAAGLVVGAGISAWYWAPALAERDAVQLAGNLTGYFDYAGHFRSARELMFLTPLVEYGIGGDGAPWSAGMLQVAFALTGLAAGLTVVRRRGFTVFWAVVAVLATAMMASISAPLWRAIEPLAFAQFPWRWLSVQALALALLAAPIGALRYGRYLAGGAAIVLVVAAMARLPVETLAVSEVTRSDLSAFELFSGNIGSTVRAEYLPAGVAPRPLSSVHLVHGRKGTPRAATSGSSVDSATLIHRGVASQEWEVETSGIAPVTVAFPTYGFPGWVASVKRLDSEGVMPVEGEMGGPPQVAGAVDGGGWITAELPNGRYRVLLELGRSDVRALAEGLSLISLCALLLLALVDPHPGWRRWLILAVASVLVAVVAARLMPLAEPGGPKTLDFARAAYPHHNPDGIRYGSSVLKDADMFVEDGEQASSEPVVDAGGAVDVDLAWENARPGWDVEAALVSPAEVQLGVPDVRASQTLPQTDPDLLHLAVPDDVASGQYFVRLTVMDDSDETVRAENGDGYDIGTAYLGPVLVRGKADLEGRSGPPVARMGDIRLQAVQSTQDGDLLEVRMYWQADREQVRDYKTSVRLLDTEGNAVASDDKATLYGFSPTTAWRGDEQIVDRRWLLLDDAPPDDGYRIEVVLYDATDPEAPLGSGQVGGVIITGSGDAEDDES